MKDREEPTYAFGPAAGKSVRFFAPDGDADEEDANPYWCWFAKGLHCRNVGCLNPNHRS